MFEETSKKTTNLKTIKIPLQVKHKLLMVDGILRACYGTPDLGNVTDPLEELLFLTIAQRTRIQTAVRIFRTFREHFHELTDILDAPDSELRELLSTGGRENLRVRSVKAILKAVTNTTGNLSLQNLRGLNQDKALEFLTSLPWVGEKTARCVMLYSLGINTFPADSNVIRIFTRTALLEPVIGSLDKVEHRRAQSLIAPAIPDKIGRTLHVNMVVHGQEICRERNPQCTRCEIRKFCALWRTSKTEEARESQFTVADLFCGAGGISLGFHDEGFRVVMAVDNDTQTLETYRLNHPWVEECNVLCDDLRSLTNKRIRALVGQQKIDVLVAGVPCQGYSRVGYRTKPDLSKEIKYEPENDPRNLLFKEVIRVARLLGPQCILLENVLDMRSANVTHYGLDRKVIELLERRLGGMGYHTGTVCLDATDFGIPQKRKRLFFIASKKQLPENLEQWLGKLADEMHYPQATPTLSDAITGLPVLSAGAGEQITSFIRDEKNGGSAYSRFIGSNTLVLFNHVARPHNGDDMRIIGALRPGESYAALVRRMPDVLNGRNHKVYTTHNFQDKFYRLKLDAPCRTIVSHLSKDGNSFIHPGQDRALTVREAARVQSFPDDFMFTGSRTSQFIQVGNAVPPMLARAFARFFRMLLEGER